MDTEYREELEEWFSARPDWERHALNGYLRDGEVSETIKRECFELFLEAKELGETDIEVDPLNFDFGGQASKAGEARLLRVRGLENVNALSRNTELPFSQGLTVVFGKNGTGKTGYVRLLSNLCASRSRADILPNVMEGEEAGEPSAQLELETESGSLEVEFGDQGPPELDSFVVLATKTHRIHLDRDHEIQMSPPGLELFEPLREIRDDIRDRLKGRIAEVDEDWAGLEFFEGDSKITNFLREEVDASIELDELRQRLASHRDVDEKIGELEARLGTLRGGEHQKQLKEARRRQKRLTGLRKKLGAAIDVLCETKGPEFKTCAKRLREQEERAEKLREGIPTDALLEDGEDSRWREFILAARKLVESAGRAEEYPSSDDRCVLCGQDLSSEAQGLIRAYWRYAEGDAEQKMRELATEKEKLDQALRGLDLELVSDGLAVREALEEEAPELLAQLVQLQSRLQSLRDELLGATDQFESWPSIEVPGRLDELARAIGERVEKLKEEEPEDEIEKAESECRRFRHISTLKKRFEELEAYVEELRWKEKAAAEKPSTASITHAHKRFFNRIVTKAYRDAFNERCESFGCHFEVEVATRGRKGKTLKSLELSTGHEPVEVLSEGEQRAVAMADFLTDVEFRPSCNGIILDDPVTSLDHDWKERLAKVLVREAEERQVIIFTHDLVFASFLADQAKYRSDCDSIFHQLSKINGAAGMVSADDPPASGSYSDKLSDANRLRDEARDGAAGSHQEALIRHGFAHLRAAYELYCENRLFGEVVRRFDDHVRIGALRPRKLTGEFVGDFIGSWKNVCRYIPGHSRGMHSGYQHVTVEDLTDAIEEFKGLKGRFNALHPQENEEGG